MITAFLPCRSGSERVPLKNTKEFGGVKGGLLKIKLNQLLEAKLIDKIVLSTNDPLVIEIAELISSQIIIDNRPEHLALSSTSTDDLIRYVPSIIDKGHVLWTHTTSPFLTSVIYDKAIEIYKQNLKHGSCDSLMTVTRLKAFLWDKMGSVNYDRESEKWPRTQTLKELFEINSGIFINSVYNYIQFEDRIGKNPFMFDTKGYTSFDIDWPEDFELAEMIYRKLNNASV